jgi:glycosyltransferase involved in cell wall biosynthesis
MIVIATLMHERGQTGVQTHFNAFVSYLRSNNKTVVVVTPFSAPGWYVWPIFAVRRVLEPISSSVGVWWYRYWHRLFLQWSLHRLLRDRSNAVIYAQCPLAAQAALNAKTSGTQRVAMVVHFNVSQADEWAEKGSIRKDGVYAQQIRQLEARILPQLGGVIYVSTFMQRELCRRIEALSAVRSVVIPNGCVSPANVGSTEIEFDLINIGTLEPRKNQQFLLQVVAEAAQRQRRVTIALVGGGPDRAMLYKLATDLKIEDRVIFLGYRTDAAQLISRARLYVHSATIENLPIALIEALASARPILAPKVGGIPDVVSNGDQGFFWNTDDVQGATTLLIRVLDDIGLQRALSTQARMRYETEFRSELIGERLLTFLYETGGAASRSASKSYVG